MFSVKLFYLSFFNVSCEIVFAYLLCFSFLTFIYVSRETFYFTFFNVLHETFFSFFMYHVVHFSLSSTFHMKHFPASMFHVKHFFTSTVYKVITFNSLEVHSLQSKFPFCQITVFLQTF